MKYFTVNLVCFALAFAVASASSIVDNIDEANLMYPHYQPAKSPPLCGGMLINPSEEIIYKPFEQLENNERCIWTVAVPSAIHYRVRVFHYGFEPEDRLLNIAAVNSSGLFNSLPNNASWTTHNANVLMVTFHSPSNSSGIKGFALKYEVDRQRQDVSPTSTHQIVGSDVIDIKYPHGDNTFGINELSTFVFPPLDIAKVGVDSRMVFYKGLTRAKYCGGSLHVYNFNSTTGKYTKRNGYICGNVDKEFLLLTDLTVMVFRSGGTVSETGDGFKLTVVNCGNDCSDK